jgi:peptidoglycan-associated lipoprotein
MWLLLLLFGLSGCPKRVPTREFKDAKDALKKARTSLATKCAKQELKSAENMMKRARALMNKGDYKSAKAAFELARKLAIKARQEADDRKQECLKELNANKNKTPGLVAPPTMVPVRELPTKDDRKSLEPVYFPFNKYTIVGSARNILQRHAEYLQKNKGAKIEISGHCDERGSVEYNLALGERRALAVKKYLINLGIARKRISTISFGHQKPADPRHNKSAYDKNRRAEFRINAK